ncbi:MAG TPA: hypothetical protein VNV66_03515, partial [Pilimelia sp.]|nr:hypothetical protein [Pilimelia sp.]
VGLGLVLGAWVGRARGLIALGLVLGLALGISTAAEHADGLRSPVTWRPASVEAMAPRYEAHLADARLDLTDVDFARRSASVRVEVNVGRLTIVLPPDVDVTAVVDVQGGEATVFGQQWRDIDQFPRTATDLGADGAGGGQLELRVDVIAGNVRIHR